MSIRITTLGRVQVTRGDTVIAALPSQRLRCAVLVYLAVTRETSRDRLLALFWAERSESRARHALSQNIYELRSVLGEDWVSLRGEQVVVSPHVTIDLLAFGEAADRGDAAAAVSMYEGAFLDGFYLPSAPAFEAWLDNQRLRAQRQHRRARRELITKLVEQARIRDALRVARDWAAIDPQDDEAQHRLIELLADTGDRTGAIRQYEAYAKLLEAEELVPLEETRLLVDRIRGGEVGTLPSPPASVGGGPEPFTPPGALPPDMPATPAAPEPETPAPSPNAAASTRRVPRRWLQAAAGLGVVALLASVGFLTTRSPGSDAVSPAVTHQLAILPLDDLSPDSSGGLIAQHLSATVIDALYSRSPLLQVRSRHSVQRFAGVSPDSAARALEADLVMAGSLVRADGQVRVMIELTDGAGTLIATEVVTLPDGRYIALVDSLTERIERVLRTRLGIHFEEQRLRRGTRSEAALAALLRARRLEQDARAAGNGRDIDRAFALLERADSLLEAAEQMDPRWSEPILQRGWTAQTRAAYAMMRDRLLARSWLDTAVAHASRVIAMEPANPHGWHLRADTWNRFEFTQPSHEEDERLQQLQMSDLSSAIEHDPSFTEAYSQLAMLQLEQGRFNEARLTAERARREDAFLRNSADILYVLALAEFEARHDEVAAELCDEGLRRFRGHKFAWCALSVMAFSDRLPALPDSAWAIAGMTGHGPDEPRDAALDMFATAVLIRAGLADSAAILLERVRTQPTVSDGLPWIEAAVRFRLGQEERAREILGEYIRTMPGAETMVRRRALTPLVATGGTGGP